MACPDRTPEAGETETVAVQKYDFNCSITGPLNFPPGTLTGDGSMLSGTGSTPSGPAGGDLANTYPNPTIKASVALTGVPTADTASLGTNTTQLATTAFVIANQSGSPSGAAGGDLGDMYPDPQVVSAALGTVVFTTNSVGSTADLRVAADQTGSNLTLHADGSSQLNADVDVTVTANHNVSLTSSNVTLLDGPTVDVGTASATDIEIGNSGSTTNFHGAVTGITAVGAAGGDLVNTYPNPVVRQISYTAGSILIGPSNTHGVSLGSGTSLPRISLNPTTGLTLDSSSVTAPGNVTNILAASVDITSTTGDIEITAGIGSVILDPAFSSDGGSIQSDGSGNLTVANFQAVTADIQNVNNVTLGVNATGTGNTNIGTGVSSGPIVIGRTGGTTTFHGTVTGVTTSGAAGGDLGSSYPNPTVKNVTGNGASITAIATAATGIINIGSGSADQISIECNNNLTVASLGGSVLLGSSTGGILFTSGANSTSAMVFTGSGVPSSTGIPNGSLYTNQSGSALTNLYMFRGGAWVAIA